MAKGPRSAARKSAIANVCIRNPLLSHNLTAGRRTVKEQVCRRRKILRPLASGRFRPTPRPGPAQSPQDAHHRADKNGGEFALVRCESANLQDCRGEESLSAKPAITGIGHLERDF